MADTPLTAAATASSLSSGILARGAAGPGAVDCGAEGGWSSAFAAGMNRRPAAVRTIAQSPVVDRIWDLLFRRFTSIERGPPDQERPLQPNKMPAMRFRTPIR